MSLLPLNDYTKETILKPEVFDDIFSENDIIQLTYLIADFSLRAKDLGVKKQFDDMVRAYKSVLKDKTQKQTWKANNDRLTEFYTEPGMDNMKCGSWIADESGVRSLSVMGMEQWACRQPVLILDRMENIETGEEFMQIAFKRNHAWKKRIVAKETLASANKIVQLSRFGLGVTSENAKMLVKYLADLEALNMDDIPTRRSSAKMGWHGAEFIPYTDGIEFDGDIRFSSIADAIGEHGSFEKWLDMVRVIRKAGRIEPRIMLAASFASVLVSKLGALPFICDLWGETEGGKTVTLMLAASVWANPGENQYISDFKTTDVALEVKADMLGNLPLILDDTSKTSARIRDNFESVVYDLCSGRGKSRSNKELGINRENRWSLCTLTNGERPLQSYTQQGGAINRIIEVECGEKVYADPQAVAETLKRNYGHAGRRFVEIIAGMEPGELQEIYKGYFKALANSEKMDKQTQSLAVILTADQISTERLFNDGANISTADAEKLLNDRVAVSDNVRCYNYIIDKIAMNSFRFDGISNTERWGLIENGWCYLYAAVLGEICERGGFSKASFLRWAERNGLIKTSGGRDGARNTVVKKIDSTAKRCVCLRIADEGVDADGFVNLDLADENAEIPFS